MPLVDLIAEFHQALDDEIQAARSGGGRHYRLHDGHRVSEYQGSFLYVFSADFEIFVPDDSPIEVKVDRMAARGFLVSVEGLSVWLELDEDLGEEVPNAELRSEPWYLLEALKDRLSDCLQPETPLNVQLAQAVLGHLPAEARVDPERAERLLAGLSYRRDAAQTRAVSAAIASNVAFVWGPPGTGKTSTLGLIARALCEAEEALLVTSHSNAAVDMAIYTLARTMAGTAALQSGGVVRFGSPRLPEVRALDEVIPRQILKRRYPDLVRAIEQAEVERRRVTERLRSGPPAQERERLQARLREVRAILAALREEFHARELELVRAARIVACTLSKGGISPEIYQRRFDGVCVDEASMAYVPQVFFAATLADKRCVILGDFRQLPPVSLADTDTARTWLQRDVFDHAGIIRRVDRNENDPRLWLLDTQYRMHPRISHIPNTVVYAGRLQNSADVEARTSPITARAPQPGEAVVLCDIGPLQPLAYREPRGQGFSHFNPFSAAVVVGLAYHSLVAGTPAAGVITPYAAQSRLIRRLTHELRLDEAVYPATVHRFQGSEREVVIFDVVDTSPMREPGLLLRGGLDTQALRLLNVAVSRAQGKLILVGDLGFLRGRCPPSSAFAAFLQAILASGPRWPFTFDELVATQPPAETRNREVIRWLNQPRDALREVRVDLEAARGEVLVSWPDIDLQDLLTSELLAALRSRAVRVAVAAPDAPLSQAFRSRHNVEVVSPAVSREACLLIDGQTFWILGWPGGFGRHRPSLRIASSSASLMLGELIGLQRLTTQQRPTPREGPSHGLGACRSCGDPRWVAKGPYGIYLRCSNGHAARMTPQDATRFAEIAGIRCERCGHAAIGRRGPNGIFLGCGAFPTCRWTGDLRRLV